MMKSDESVFHDAGTLLETSSQSPFLLNGHAGGWYVEHGHVDVFAVHLRGGKPVSRRRHLCRFGTGEIVFGLDAARDGVGLLAVGAMGTRLRIFDAVWIEGAAWDRERGTALAQHVEGWIEKLTAGAFPLLPPKEHTELVPGEEMLLHEGVTLRAREHMCWIRHVEGASRLMGLSDFPLVNGEGPFPINRTLWLETACVVRLRTCSTQEVIECGAFPDALARLHGSLLDAVAVRLQQEKAREHDRLRHKTEVDATALADGADHLATILDRTEQHRVTACSDPLLAACRIVGEVIGVDMQAPPSPEELGNRRRDRLKEIARISRVRYRKVALRGRWWASDGGPLLGLLRDDETQGGRPVALLPVKGRRYVLRDPATGRTETVTEELSERLHPLAYSFYRPFPDRVLTAWDVFKFGAEGCRKDLLLILVLGVAGGILNMVAPVVTGAVFNTVIPEAERTQLGHIVAALLTVAVAVALFQLVRGIAVLRVESRMDASVQSAVWDRLLNLPTPFFRRFSAGDLALRAGSISSIRQLLSGVTVSSMLGGLFSVFNFGLLFYYDGYLAFWATGLTLMALGVSLVGGYVQLRHQRRVSELQSMLAGRVLQFITGITKLRVAGAESKAFEIWAQGFGTQRRLQYKARRVGNVTATFNAVYPLLSSGVIFAVMIMVQEPGELMVTGDFVAFNAALGTFTASMLSMTGAFVALQTAIPLYEQAKPILEARPEVDTSRATPGLLSGEIELKHVSFRYEADGPLVLDDVSVQARPGEFVALVGPSGSGKSTILRLLLGFETAESGTIYYDGQDLDGLDIQAVRRQIGVVLQNGRLMSGDLFTNIAGATAATLEDAWTAARMAGLDEDIRQMPMGMHTVISDGGGTLSGGQRQRLMIARAVVNRPRLLFFDEATSALDNRTQQIVSESLERLQATRIVVAHRLSTIRNADRIYVIDRGRVVQEGTYEELMREDGVFAALARRQLA